MNQRQFLRLTNEIFDAFDAKFKSEIERSEVFSDRQKKVYNGMCKKFLKFMESLENHYMYMYFSDVEEEEEEESSCDRCELSEELHDLSDESKKEMILNLEAIIKDLKK